MSITFEKRGLSPVIATVLLVVLALVLAAIIFLWARGFVTEQLEKQGKPTDQVCKDVSFEIDSTSVGGGVEVQIVNRGNVPIYNFDVKFVGVKDSSIRTFNFGVDGLSISAGNPLDCLGTSLFAFSTSLTRVASSDLI